MISDELKKRIIDLYCNTKIKPYDLYEIISANNYITDEEFYDFLNNYKMKDGKKLKKNFDIINKKIDECIYKLRSKGYDYEQISEELKRQYIDLGKATVYTRCRQIFAEKGEEVPRSKIRKRKTDKSTENNKKCKESKRKPIKKATNKKSKKPRGKQILINEDELYRLRKSGLSLYQISEYYKSFGIDISAETIRVMCERIFKQKGEKEPKYDKLGYRYDEAIYIIGMLRQQGLAYAAIKEELTKVDIIIGTGKIKSICEELSKNSKDEFKYKSKVKREASDEEIYKLRKEQGLSLHETTEYFHKKGIKVSYSYIAAASERIFKERGEKSPQSKSKRTKALKQWNDEIYNLRKQGLSFPSIKSYLDDKGLKLGVQTIRNRCEEIFNQRGETVPGIGRKNRNYKAERINSQRNKVDQINKDKISKESILDVVMKIKEKRQATEEQMNKFIKEVSKMYKIDLEQDIKEKNEIEK